MVFWGSAVLLTGFVLWGLFAPENLGSVMTTALGWVIRSFGWGFILIAFGALVMCIFLVVHPWGIAAPELSLFAALDALPLALTRRPFPYCWIRALREEALPGPGGGEPPRRTTSPAPQPELIRSSGAGTRSGGASPARRAEGGRTP